ncbi:hypothetical protein TorRG33x02_204620 [Trema orientale]|uniref:Uncharacterized protein n=1 Tax=Trema orientale TaxID=63057 RepID=A0A2P5EDN7_TREOI|nr:hypothetical protein TorRG33x02_204620 [Trema orientale]
MATLDLVFDTKTKKILYAEAKKDFIDFLVSLLTLPAATVIGLLTKSTNIGMVGCLGSLYTSIENMSEIYLQPKYKKDKDSILRPNLLEIPPLLSNMVESSWPKLYTCSNYDGYACDDPHAICPDCDMRMDEEIEYVEANEKENRRGFVTQGPSFLIRDDLHVEPMSISAVSALHTEFNKKGVRSDDLQSKRIDISMTEGLKLLQASWQCKTVLNSVLLDRIVGPQEPKLLP